MCSTVVHKWKAEVKDSKSAALDYTEKETTVKFRDQDRWEKKKILDWFAKETDDMVSRRKNVECKMTCISAEIVINKVSLMEV